MSLVEELHEAHKARQARMGAIPRPVPTPALPPPPPFAVGPTPRKRRSHLTPLQRQRRAKIVDMQLARVVAKADRLKAKLVALRGSYEPAPAISVQDIQAVVAAHFGVSVLDINSCRRMAEIVKPRQIAMVISRILTPLSLPSIGHLFGGRDHTTVLHSIRKYEALMASDPETALMVGELCGEIRDAHA